MLLLLLIGAALSHVQPEAHAAKSPLSGQSKSIREKPRLRCGASVLGC